MTNRTSRYLFNEEEFGTGYSFSHFSVFIRLESTDLNGGDRKRHYDLNGKSNVFGFDIYNDNFYWTDNSNKWAIRSDKSFSLTKLVENLPAFSHNIKVFATPGTYYF